MTLASPALPVLISEGETDFGNTRATAFALPLSAIVTGHVGIDDQAGVFDWADVFAITMPTAGRISLRLDGLSKNIDLLLNTGDGKGWASSHLTGTSPETIESELEAGLWHVWVYPWIDSVGSAYRLSVERVMPQQGTPGNDTLQARHVGDTIHGGDGDDLILDLPEWRPVWSGIDRFYGGAGNDTILAVHHKKSEIGGGGGADRIETSFGSDTIWGGAGRDTIKAGGNNDLVYGGHGRDVLYGEEGDDRLYGGDGNDTIYGGYLTDWLYGDDGDDVIEGGFGHDLIYGGAGDDTLYGDAGRDTIYGGSGDDLIVFEGLAGTGYGGTGNDTLQGGPKGATLHGDDGDDLLVFDGPSGSGWGGTGNDTLQGGAGAHTLGGGDGDDLIIGGIGRITVWAGAGNDTVMGGDGDDWLMAGAGRDVLTGGGGADRFEFRRDFGLNRIHDFDATEGDTLGLGQGMWAASHGVLTGAQVVQAFGRVNALGDAVLDFTAVGTIVTLVGAGSLDGLADSIVIL